MPRIPAGMRKTTRGTYESRFTIHGKRYSVYGKTVKECKEKELARRQEIEEGLRYSGRELTLDQYFLKWEQGRLGSVRASTIRTERYIYRLALHVLALRCPANRQIVIRAAVATVDIQGTAPSLTQGVENRFDQTCQGQDGCGWWCVVDTHPTGSSRAGQFGDGEVFHGVMSFVFRVWVVPNGAAKL